MGPSFRETFDLLCPRRLADRIVEEIIEQGRAEEEDEMTQDKAPKEEGQPARGPDEVLISLSENLRRWIAHERHALRPGFLPLLAVDLSLRCH